MPLKKGRKPLIRTKNCLLCKVHKTYLSNSEDLISLEIGFPVKYETLFSPKNFSGMFIIKFLRENERERSYLNGMWNKVERGLESKVDI